MERLEERIEDFQETMERVNARFLDKFGEKNKNKKPEEEKKNSDTEKKDIVGTILEQDEEDHDMIDQSEEAELSFRNEVPLKKQPGVKVESNDAEMIKPADHSDSEINN